MGQTWSTVGLDLETHPSPEVLAAFPAGEQLVGVWQERARMAGWCGQGMKVKWVLGKPTQQVPQLSD